VILPSGDLPVKRLAVPLLGAPLWADAPGASVDVGAAGAAPLALAMTEEASAGEIVRVVGEVA